MQTHRSNTSGPGWGDGENQVSSTCGVSKVNNSEHRLIKLFPETDLIVSEKADLTTVMYHSISSASSITTAHFFFQLNLCMQ